MIAPAWVATAVREMVLPVQATGADVPLPAEPPITGPLWSVVVPALLLLLATVATVMLYRHFAGDEPELPERRPGEPPPGSLDELG